MRVNAKATLTPGTPLQISAVLGLEDNYVANRVSIQMATGGTGIGYVMDGIGIFRTLTFQPPSKNNSGDVTLELAPASAAGPGGQYADPPGAIQFRLTAGIDLRQLWMDGSQADPVRVSAVLEE